MAGLQTNIRSLGGIYKRYASFLEKLGIINLSDFLYHIPFRYDDYSIISKISEAQPGEIVTIRGQVIEVKNQYTRRHFTLQKAKVKDETGTINVLWFNQPYITRAISEGDFISMSGKIEQKKTEMEMMSPNFEIGTKDFIHTGRLVPVYPETRGVSSKWIRRQAYKLLNENKNELNDYMPEEILGKNNLDDLYTALLKVHFPDKLDDVTVGRKRLSFDELFLIQASSILRKEEWQKTLLGYKFKTKSYEKKIDDFIKKLPFKLTGAQKRTIQEIFNDFSSEKPMNRLLEGDVGSGKTVVAAIAIYLTYLNGFQSVFMAPTEILAQQHFRTISTLLEPFGLKIGLQTGSIKTIKIKDLRLKNKEKNHKSSIINHQSFDVLVGTHAVISEKINYKKLGFIVIDEQQRFGVEQRGILRKKGKNPHVLTMTATPIPRTIALTIYGDLSLSLLDEMPRGRKIIKTWLTPKEKRDNAYEWIKKQIKENGSQIFIICPFIEESETMTTVKAAAKEFETLQKNVFKDYKLALLHGKLKSKEKQAILADFKDRKYNILVATPIVEVGIDIPNADVILIEASERFGLSQLHQLRGRVGRNDRQAYCLLFTESTSPITTQRLQAMEKTNIGAELAELDLKLRGPGEIFGTHQSGRTFLKIANFSDFDLIKNTKIEAEKTMPKLSKYKDLETKIKEINSKEISPD